jgi:hypothetical protein
VKPSSPRPSPNATRTASAAVAITCPEWCQIGADEHASRLWANEGRCVHQTFLSVGDPAGKRGWGLPPRFCAPIELTLSMTTNPGGREVESADVLINGQESNLEQLVLLAAAIADLATLYRQTPGARGEMPVR